MICLCKKLLCTSGKKTNQESTEVMDSWSFKYAVEGWFMPAVSLFGVAGHALSIYILHHREVKLKTDFVEVLCSLATYDNLLLISTFFLFTLPTLSSTYFKEVCKEHMHSNVPFFFIKRL